MRGFLFGANHILESGEIEIILIVPLTIFFDIVPYPQITGNDFLKNDMALKLTELEAQVGQQLNSEVQANMLTFDPKTGDFVNAAG